MEQPDFANEEDAQEQKRSTETAQSKMPNLLSGGSTKAKKQTREQCDEAYLKADHEAHVDSLVVSFLPDPALLFVC